MSFPTPLLNARLARVRDICALIGAISMRLNRDVDVVPLDQCHFAEKIRRMGMVRTANKLPD